jgi:hypothetical protein
MLDLFPRLTPQYPFWFFPGLQRRKQSLHSIPSGLAAGRTGNPNISLDSA